MKVILTADIKNIGQKGDEKEVKPGFARNFLFPKKLAIVADSPEGIKLLAAKESQAQEHEGAAKKIAEVVGKNQGLELTFKSKASSEGKLFGSIKISQIESAVKEKTGTAPVKIEPNGPIKIVGEHQLTAIFSEGQTLDFKVIVEPEKSSKKS